MDGVYTINIRRYADKDLPLITDEDGTKYFDNKIDLKILRKDGTTFYSRSFSKKRFQVFYKQSIWETWYFSRIHV